MVLKAIADGTISIILFERIIKYIFVIYCSIVAVEWNITVQIFCLSCINFCFHLYMTFRKN